MQKRRNTLGGTVLTKPVGRLKPMEMKPLNQSPRMTGITLDMMDPIYMTVIDEISIKKQIRVPEIDT
jgi:hypothetical protein